MKLSDWDKAGKLDQKASRREQVLFALVLVAVVAGFFRLGCSSASARLQTAKIKASALQMETDALRKFQETTPVVSRSFARSKNIKVRVLLGDVHSDIREATTLMPLLTEPALLGGLALKGFHFLSTVAETGYTMTEFILLTEGKFADNVQYLEKLENFPALFSIKSLALKMGDAGTHVEGEIVGRFFHLSDAGLPDSGLDKNTEGH